jgi:hypothetical protein
MNSLRTETLVKCDLESYKLQSQLFYEITDQDLFEQVLLIRTDLDNRNKYLSYLADPIKMPININGYGVGKTVNEQIL